MVPLSRQLARVYAGLTHHELVSLLQNILRAVPRAWLVLQCIIVAC